MKRILFLMVLFCMGILSGFAQDDNFSYTDGNGMTWGGYVGYDFDTQKIEVGINTTSCNSEEVVVIPDEITYAGEKFKVTKLGSVFSENKIIEKVTIPNTVTRLNYTFKGCSALSEVVNTSQLKTVNNAFHNCSSLKSIDLSSCEMLGSGSFGGCTQLENVVLKVCKRIESGAFCDYGGSNNCPKLKSVGDISHCESIGEYAFQGCCSLTSVDLSSCKTLKSNAFNGCSALERVELPNLKSWDNSVFENCKKLISVTFPETIDNIPALAFCNCENLSTIDLSHCSIIGGGAFYNCTSLTDLKLLNVKQTEWTTYFDYESWKSCKVGSFMNCNNLTSVDLGSIQKLGDRAFYGCTSLKKITLPSTITNLGWECFDGVTIVTSMATVPPVINKPEDETSSIPMGEFLVNVPEASLFRGISGTAYQLKKQFSLR